jgi:succinate dehydrogenase / fumarate reductase flavoprotein subunit
MYYKIVDEDPKTPMMIYPKVLYRWVELGLIIITNNNSRLFLYWRIKLLRSRSKQVRSFSFDARFGRWLFCSSLYIGDYLSPDIKNGPISTDSEFEAAEKGVKEQIEKS